jgi:hypothetical protein
MVSHAECAAVISEVVKLGVYEVVVVGPQLYAVGMGVGVVCAGGGGNGGVLLPLGVSGCVVVVFLCSQYWEK